MELSQGRRELVRRWAGYTVFMCLGALAGYVLGNWEMYNLIAEQRELLDQCVYGWNETLGLTEDLFYETN